MKNYGDIRKKERKKERINEWKIIKIKEKDGKNERMKNNGNKRKKERKKEKKSGRS